MGGYAPSFNEVNDQTKTDLTKAELIAFPILALLLLLVFRGVVAAGIPLLIGGVSIVGTLLVLRVMSLFVDTSIFALNIATALSLGLAVDYALLMVSRYREEIERERRDPGGAPAHGRPPPGAPPSSPGFTVAARDGGAGDPAAALPLLDGGRRRLGRAALGDDRAARRPLAAGPARDADRRPLDPPRRLGLGRVRRLVPARPLGDAAPGRRRAGQLRPAARRRRAAALDDADRPQLRLRPPQQARLRSQQLRRSPLPARRHRGGHGHRRRAAPGRARAGRFGRRVAGGRRGHPRHALLPRLRRGRLRQLRARRAGGLRGRPGHGQRDPRPGPAGGDARRWSPATRPASSTRSRASPTTCRC